MLMIDDTNFDAEVLQSKLPVMIDFSAQWCGPCKMLAPIIEEIAKEKQDELKICTVDIDKSPNLARKYAVLSIPSLVFIKDGEYKNKLIGLRPKNEILDAISSNI